MALRLLCSLDGLLTIGASTLTAVAANGSFLLAENFHFSGVLATVAAGLLMGNLGVSGKMRTEVSFPPVLVPS